MATKKFWLRVSAACIRIPFSTKKAKQIQKPPSKSNCAIVFCFLLKTTFKKKSQESLHGSTNIKKQGEAQDFCTALSVQRAVRVCAAGFKVYEKPCFECSSEMPQQSKTAHLSQLKPCKVGRLRTENTRRQGVT